MAGALLSNPGMIWVELGRLLLALVLGAVVGLERELRGRPAGMRTSAFICCGAALFTICSEVLARQYGGDPQRIASQIIPGIGFLGAGAVLRSRGAITGLTSAATVFVVASIGMASGGGLYTLAAAATALMLLVLAGLRWVELRFRLKKSVASFVVTGKVHGDLLTDLTKVVEGAKTSFSYVKLNPVGEHFAVEFGVRLPAPEVPDFVRRLQQTGSIDQILPTTETESEKD